MGFYKNKEMYIAYLQKINRQKTRENSALKSRNEYLERQNRRLEEELKKKNE